MLLTDKINTSEDSSDNLSVVKSPSSIKLKLKSSKRLVTKNLSFSSIPEEKFEKPAYVEKVINGMTIR